MAKTIQPRKQRKRRAQAPLHARGAFVHVHLSKDLRAKLKHRAVRVRKGDKVKVLRGSFAGKEGKILSVNLREGKVAIEGLTRRKARGQEVSVPVDPSNIVLTEMVERK